VSLAIVNQLELRLTVHGVGNDGNSYPVVDILVDGAAIATFDAYATDLDELGRRLAGSGDFESFSRCSDKFAALEKKGVPVRGLRRVS
jgi:hypothetical protein